MRKLISRKYVSYEFILVFTGLLLSYNLRYGFDPAAKLSQIIGGAVGVFVTGIGIYFIQFRLIAEYDDTYLYLARGKRKITLPMERIMLIKLTVFTSWIVTYKDMDDRKISVLIPAKSVALFTEFVAAAKKANPNLKYNPFVDPLEPYF